MIKFTEGPWSLDQYGAIVDKNGETIRIRASVSIPMSFCVPIGDEARPNAHLIAAAPEMYAALAALIEDFDNLGPYEGPDRENIEAGRLALAKARGEV